MDIEGLDMNQYKTCYVPFDSTKSNFLIFNDPVKNKENNIASNDEE